MALGLHYAREIENRKLHLQNLMEEGQTGYSLPLSFESVVTDSASAAVQMAAGQEVRPETLGLDPNGGSIETIVEWAEDRGIGTGIVTNMRLTHATPAGFAAAHQVSRYNPEPDILDDILVSDIEVLLGGGARAIVPRGRRVSELLDGLPEELDGDSRREDDSDPLGAAEERGYRIVSDRSSLAEAATESDRLLGLFAASHFPYVLDRRALGLDEQVPTLAEMTRAALAVLARSEQGFFLMVEGGRIDYAGHANDAGTMLHEILDFDEAVGVGMEFQESHPETLLIVTADHGTGGFSFTYGDGFPKEEIELPSGEVYDPDHNYPGREQLEIIGRQKASYELILERAGLDPDRLVEEVERHTGLVMSRGEAETALARDEKGRAHITDFSHFYGDSEDNESGLLARALARHTFVVWSTGGHTMEPVLTFGTGPGSEKLRGVYRNTALYEVMKEALSPLDADVAAESRDLDDGASITYDAAKVPSSSVR